MNTSKPDGAVISLHKHLKPRRPGEASPVALDRAFVEDLDKALALNELVEKSTGESARTFFSAVKLINTIRPKTVILENVSGAPWDMYTKQIFPKICYVARYVRLDTKDFYLPQTRVRGYLVAVDAQQIGEGPATEVADGWKALLSTTCKRPASAPVSLFLRASDDPATIAAKADMETKVTVNSEWGLSSLRHFDERRRHGLGRDDNPFSMKAMRNSRLIFASYPSHSWLRFWELQGSRVIDSMDILFAAAKGHNIDLSYKTCVVDVSQNVDRTIKLPGRGDKVTTATLNLGIIGCITPRGMPIVTDLLRPVTGTETLALQGMPTDELVISTEAQSQLRDLAGNAMTVTVVGAATLALLHSITRVPAARVILPPMGSARSSRGLYLDPQQLEWEPLDSGNAETVTTIDLGSLLAIAKDMVRMCHCLTRERNLLVCGACGTTACTACGGNPVHDFKVKEIQGPTLSAEEGEVRLKKLLPKTLMLSVPPHTVHHGLKLAGDQFYRRVVSEILRSDTIYYFDEIKVTEAVTVCYKAANSIARLVLSADSVSCWYIFVAAWHSERATFDPKFDFDQPIARGRLLDGASSSIEWSLWAPGHINLTLDLRRDPGGALVAGELSFAGDSGLESEPSLQAWKEAVEREVSGAYMRHPACGTAGNMLHIKQGSAADAKVFLMWDSGRVRNPSEDHFVWTKTMRRLEPHEYREVLLHAKSTLRWDLDSGLGSVDVYWPGHWSSSDEPGTPKLESQGFIRSPAQIRWGSTETLQQAPCHAGGPSVTQMPVLAAVMATLDRFPVSPARIYKMDASRFDGDFYAVPATARDAFLKTFAFLSSQVGSATAPAPEETLASFPHLRGAWVQVDACQACSVAPPEISFRAKQVPAAKGDDKSKPKYVYEIIEDPDEAARFERQFQDLPRAVAVAARLLHDSAGRLVLDMRVMLHSKTLASRALGHLVQAHRTAARGRLALGSHARTSFTVSLNYAFPSTAVFAPFCDSLKPSGAEHTAGIDLSKPWGTTGDKQPPRFGRYRLRESQKEAVAWMEQRERGSLGFAKVEFEEEVVRPLNMRAVGKAEWTSCFPYSARGGVVAHEIGYGKTVVMLALLDYMRRFDRTVSIQERLEKVDSAWAQEIPRPFGHFGCAGAGYPALDAGPFFEHLDATLILVPKHIVNQWANEAKKFLSIGGDKVVKLIKPTALYECNIGVLKKAEIIIVSTAALTSPIFLDRLEVVGGRAGGCPKGISGRTLELWYRRALRNHRILTAYYLAGQAAGIGHDELVRRLRHELLPALIGNQHAELDMLVQKIVPEINRKFYKEGQHSSNPKTADKEAEPCVPAPEFTAKHWDIHWLHSCSFARIIWDECSYDESSNISLFIANAVANAKWLISGTPKLFGLEEVCRIASAFGIHVARPEPRMMPGLPAVTKGPELTPMSKSEQFHVFSSPLKSAALAHERHTQGHKFVAEYFRANPLEQGLEVEFEEHVRPVAMSTVAAARYFMLNQAVLDAGYDFTALPAHARNEVPLRGGELACRDGWEAAKMFLGLAACDLGREVGSVGVLVRHLSEQGDALSGQMKMLWDKMMWLRSWIRDLKLDPNIRDPGSKFVFPRSAQDALDRVESLCNSLTMALDKMSFENFGGRDLFQRLAAVVAGLSKRRQEECRRLLDLDDDSFRAAWGERFGKDWIKEFNREKALYTWLDFFDVSPSVVGALSSTQIRTLAKEMCWLRRKVSPTASALGDGALDGLFVRHALAPGVSRAIPDDIRTADYDELCVVDELNNDGVRAFLYACIREKPEKETWARVKNTYVFDGIEETKGLQKKLAFQNRLRELNLKFNSGTAIPKLKEMLWRHERGLAVAESYRDGRAPPDKHRDFEAATGCVKWGKPCDKGKQIHAATEELKNTMVALLKTLDDLTTTWLEAKFVPEFASLADNYDTDGEAASSKKKWCHQCGKTLGSLDSSLASSFLVVACGHLLCEGCRFGSASYYCPVTDCTAFIRERPVLRSSQIRNNNPDGGRTTTKVAAIVDLIKHEIPKRDHVVVFAQYGPLIDALDEAFAAAGVTFTNLVAAKEDRVSAELERFKEGRNGQVLLLDIDSDTSAGSNLTVASHVVFANPYVHRDRAHQARTVRQARGRCVRLGQTRKVHVYHFVVPGTVEEETLRELGEESGQVRAFFEGYARVPWWLDQKGAGGCEVEGAREGEAAVAGGK